MLNPFAKAFEVAKTIVSPSKKDAENIAPTWPTKKEPLGERLVNHQTTTKNPPQKKNSESQRRSLSPRENQIAEELAQSARAFREERKLHGGRRTQVHKTTTRTTTTDGRSSIRINVVGGGIPFQNALDDITMREVVDERPVSIPQPRTPPASKTQIKTLTLKLNEKEREALKMKTELQNSRETQAKLKKEMKVANEKYLSSLQKFSKSLALGEARNKKTTELLKVANDKRVEVEKELASRCARDFLDSVTMDDVMMENWALREQIHTLQLEMDQLRLVVAQPELFRPTDTNITNPWSGPMVSPSGEFVGF